MYNKCPEQYKIMLLHLEAMETILQAMKALNKEAGHSLDHAIKLNELENVIVETQAEFEK